MELRHLRYFVAVAEELHFGRAARRLHIVQPTLSAQIQRLEAELGAQLFHRTKRSVRLTEAGKAFLVEARLALEHSERAVREARRMAASETGRLDVGFVPSATYSVLTDVVGLYRRRYPGVDLVPREMHSSVQVEALLEGSIEVGFLRLPSDHESDELEVRPFVREQLVAVLPRGHRLASLRRVPLEALAGESFLIPRREREPGYHEQLLEVCGTAGFVPKVAQETTELQVGMALTATGGYVGLFPASTRHVKMTGVVFKRLAEPVPEMELSVAWQSGELSPATRAFLGICEEVSGRKIVDS
ncbi:transcriptional regulator, LysR family [Rubrobacter xylanophilus DSM 9941]|uniref:Transcriptional regulator, LysR family n=1 Tax=Rubrobacter xylanophilus (strain DSM 9941 / JCM 11954 / NBRC 16129 / PRD-1) TaxID=266117 RepID=Q1ATU8_RUBXD|nr:LysR substrate-binding domain-containing protein [Rubrobacter xylanophilus]ABG05180.1 transcriptional regulator, LysR family [Rubrobacter xylanophilus DSM 9941]